MRNTIIDELDGYFSNNIKQFKSKMHTSLKSDAYFETKEPQYKLNTVKIPSEEDFKSDECHEEKVET